MKKIIVLQGPPACGKSTKSAELLRQYGVDNAVIVCRDSIREASGEYWVPSREDYVSDIEIFAVKNALDRNLIPIIDATNLNPNTISKWKKIAEEYKAEIEWVEVVVPYHEALKRDSNTDRKRPVGKKVLRNFYMKYYPDLIAPLSDDRKMMSFNDSKKKVILIDIDGTIALRDNRSPFEYEKVYTDKVDHRMQELLSNIICNCDYDIIFLTGREDIGNCRKFTEKWINDYIYPQYWEKFKGVFDENWTLMMRSEGDHRSDDITKKEIFEKHIEPLYDVVAVFEDRDRVVKMWRDLGILCLQPYYGDF